jgi:hypothetical protein
VSFLLDTNVISESAKPRPEPRVMRWLAAVDEDDVFLSVVTFAELRRGIDRLAHGHRRTGLDVWLRENLPARFDGRILPIDAAVADAWGRLVAKRESAGRPIGTMDAFIAATAMAFSLTLVTRNESDFKGSVDDIVNPWK